MTQPRPAPPWATLLLALVALAFVVSLFYGGSL
jgi:hypothetical protein